MSLISRLLRTVQSWRRRRVGLRTDKRSAVSLERLDDRQLLSVNFTGNVPIDFPATESPGVAVIQANPATNITPVIAPALQPIVKVSGFQIDGIRLTYTPSDDTLSIGLDQPPSQNAGQGQVIAGDADNNGNDGTVNPQILALPDFSGFMDFPAFGGSEEMGAFLDLNNSGVADVVAGFSPVAPSPTPTDPAPVKSYQVAQAVVNPILPNTAPGFGTELPQFEGNVYKVNSPQHPNLEFSIAHFSQLYLQETGHALTPNSVIGIGGFGGSANDVGIGEEYFPEQTFTLSQATPPTHVCPPASPPVLINPHENKHVNTAHPELVRVSILGTSGFNVNSIIPSTVTLGGAHPIFAFTRNVVHHQFLDETFVFNGDQIKLPPGITQATVTGMLTDGTTFSTSETIFNRDYSFYTAGDIAQQQARWAARGGDIPDLAATVAKYERKAGSSATFTYSAANGATPASVTSDATTANPSTPMSVDYSVSTPATGSNATTTVPATIPDGASLASGGPVVSIKKRQPVISGHSSKGTKVSNQLLNSMDQYFQSGLNQPSSASTSAT